MSSSIDLRLVLVGRNITHSLRNVRIWSFSGFSFSPISTEFGGILGNAGNTEQKSCKYRHFMQWQWFYIIFSQSVKFHNVYPPINYMFKVTNRNTRTKCEICPKLTKAKHQSDAIGVVLVSLFYLFIYLFIYWHCFKSIQWIIVKNN